MALLNPWCLFGGNTDAMINAFLEAPASAPGQRHCLQAQFLCPRHGTHYVRGIASSRDAHRDVPWATQSFELPCEDFLKSPVIGNSSNTRTVHRQGQGRQSWAIERKAPHKLRCYVLCVGSATPVAKQQSISALPYCADEQLGRFCDRCDVFCAAEKFLFCGDRRLDQLTHARHEAIGLSHAPPPQSSPLPYHLPSRLVTRRPSNAFCILLNELRGDPQTNQGLAYANSAPVSTSSFLCICIIIT